MKFISTAFLTLKLLPKKQTCLLETRRELLLRSVQNPKLESITHRLYRSHAIIGSGSTADAIRFEAQTGNRLSMRFH